MPTSEKNQPYSRRALLRSAGLLSAVAVGSTLARAQDAATPATAAATPEAEAKPKEKPVTAPGDLEILNFALGLEHLEQSFYQRAIDANASRKYLHGRFAEVLPTLRDNETAHVQALMQAITEAGGTPVVAPTFSFPRDVFISPVAFARFAYTLEEIGVGAYLGAVGLIQSRDIRRAAASIYGTETRHAAVLRHLGGFQFSPRYYEGPLTVAEVQGLIAPFVRG